MTKELRGKESLGAMCFQRDRSSSWRGKRAAGKAQRKEQTTASSLLEAPAGSRKRPRSGWRELSDPSPSDRWTDVLQHKHTS